MFKTPDISNVIKSTDDILMLSKIIDDDKWIVKYKDVKMIYTEKPSIQIDIKEI
jgi:Holliday junction resolvase RusA-like endonuclease